MIQVRYFGRLGNRLFQYCTGRILAEELGMTMLAKPIPGFPRTQDKVLGDMVSPTKKNLREHWSGFDLELEKVIQDRTRRFIRLDGACSQNYRRDYLRYADRMREWCTPEVSEVSYPPGEVLVVHVRLGDYEKRGYTLSERFYEKLLDGLVYTTLVVVTDNKRSEYLNMFKRWDAVITSASEMDDFKYLIGCRRLIMSASTFSWWAAFLGQQREIYFPIPKAGYWSPHEYPHIDLTMGTDRRYRYVGDPG